MYFLFENELELKQMFEGYEERFFKDDFFE